MNIKYFQDTDTLYIEFRKEAVTEARDQDERARLVDSLMLTLNPVHESVAAAWLATVQRRLGDLDSGRVEAVPGAEVFEKVRRRLCRPGESE